MNKIQPDQQIEVNTPKLTNSFHARN